MVSVGCNYSRSIFLQIKSSFHYYYYYKYYFPKRKERCTRRQWHVLERKYSFQSFDPLYYALEVQAQQEKYVVI